MKAKEQNSARRPIPSTTSTLIDLLRFPLIVGVVFIHAEFNRNLLPAEGIDSIPIYHFLVDLLSHTTTLVCVPLFFIFSGYLFYFGVERFDTAIYKKRLRSRFRSLFIPYLFWNLLLYVAFMLLSDYVTINSPAKDAPFPFCLWAAEYPDASIHYPLAGQFWFIRDLIVCVVISPLLFLLIKHTRHIGIILLGLAWFLDLRIPYAGSCGFSPIALFYFSLGGWCAIFRPDLAATAKQIRHLGLLWPIFVTTQFIPSLHPYLSITRPLMIFTGVIFCANIAVWLIEKYNAKPVALLSASSFFIFAYHAHWGQSPIRRLMFAIFNPESDMAYSLVYLTHTIITIAIGVAIYHLISRIAPRFTAFITGGR